MEDCNSKKDSEKPACECLNVIKQYNERVENYKREKRDYDREVEVSNEYKNLTAGYGEWYKQHQDEYKKWKFGWKNWANQFDINDNDKSDWCRGDAAILESDRRGNWFGANDWMHKRGEWATEDYMSDNRLHNGYNRRIWPGGNRGVCVLTQNAINAAARDRLPIPKVRPEPRQPEALNLTCCSLAIDAKGNTVNIDDIRQQCGNQISDEQRKRENDERDEKKRKRKEEEDIKNSTIKVDTMIGGRKIIFDITRNTMIILIVVFVLLLSSCSISSFILMK